MKMKRSTIYNAITYVGIIACYCFFLNHSLTNQRSRYLENISSGGESRPIPFLYNYGNCDASQSPYSKLEPPNDLYYIGTSFREGSRDTAINLPKYGLRGPFAVYGIKFTLDGGKLRDSAVSEKLQKLASAAAKVGSVLHLDIGAEEIDLDAEQADYESFADHLLSVNRDLGVPVLISWGSGMNNPMMSELIDPEKYISSFRGISRAVRLRTNLTALVWQPLISVIPAERAPGHDIPSVYWPGRHYVDWVGVDAFMESLRDPHFKESFRRFYGGVSLSGYAEYPFPVAIISSKHSEKLLASSGDSLESVVKAWSYLLSNEFLMSYPKLKLIMLPELDGEILGASLLNLDSGKRIGLFGSTHEISFVCSGMVNCRTKRALHALGRFSRWFSKHFVNVSVVIQSIHSTIHDALYRKNPVRLQI